MRLGIFGGTFDPIHCAHITVAQEAAEALVLDRVLFIPAGVPPHKRGTATPFKDRLRMVELACAPFPQFVPSRIEEGNAKSYSIRTIERLHEQFPGEELFFIIGADAFAEITTWYRWRDVLAAVEFVVVTRPGHDYSVPPGARVRRLDTLALPVSSSEIREALARGESPAELSEPVLRYIKDHHLYQNTASAQLQGANPGG